MGQHFKRNWFSIFFTFCVLLIFLPHLMADPGNTTVPNPGEKILIIYNTSDTSSNNSPEAAANVMDALTANGPAGSPGHMLPFTPNPTIDVVTVSSGAPSLYAALGAKKLSDYCQVWDLRFQGQNPNNVAGATDESTLTFPPTANDDYTLFYNFLKQGGHLFIQGENAGFTSRNESVIRFLSTISGSTMAYPGVGIGDIAYNTFYDGPFLNFKTDFNNLSTVTLHTGYPGGIALGAIGNGTTMVSGSVLGINSAIALFWNSGNLITGNGMIYASFDITQFSGTSTMTTKDYYYWPDTNYSEAKYIQNIYDYLSNCYNFTITKSIDKSPICIGENTIMHLCYNNTGTKTLPNVDVWDTIPTCISLVTSTPAPLIDSTSGIAVTRSDGVKGIYYHWNVGNVPGLSSACVDITISGTSKLPCP